MSVIRGNYHLQHPQGLRSLRSPGAAASRGGSVDFSPSRPGDLGCGNYPLQHLAQPVVRSLGVPGTICSRMEGETDVAVNSFRKGPAFGAVTLLLQFQTQHKYFTPPCRAAANPKPVHKRALSAPAVSWGGIFPPGRLSCPFHLPFIKPPFGGGCNVLVFLLGLG